MSDILSISGSAVAAYQRALGTTSNNIANLSTVGYSRQSVDMSAGAPQAIGQIYVGTGVQVTGIKRSYDQFIEGAKGGFEIAIKIIPYLVAMLVAISVLRSSGAFEFITNGLVSLFSTLGFDTNFVSALPTALMKPLSGSGARAMMIDTMNTYGADSFAGRLAGIFQGSSDTTFYVVAVYFGSIGIKNTRYSIPSMLLADLVGILTAIGIAYLFFGV
jgi:spore maturation protein SpmB